MALVLFPCSALTALYSSEQRKRLCEKKIQRGPKESSRATITYRPMSDLLPDWLQPAALRRFSNQDKGECSSHYSLASRSRSPSDGLSVAEAGEYEPNASNAMISPRPPPPVLCTSTHARGDPNTLPPHFVTLPASSFTLGFVTGLYTSANRASLVFMAENAHRRPETVQGWYFYNKTKVDLFKYKKCYSYPSPSFSHFHRDPALFPPQNYKVLLAGAKGGLATGLRLSAWVTAFMALDEAFGAGRLSLANYVQQLRVERQYRRRRLQLERSRTGGTAELASQPPTLSLEETAMEALQASLESMRGIASGGTTSPDTLPPGIGYPLATYNTDEDLKHLEQLQSQGVQSVTYVTSADVKKLELPQFQDHLESTERGQMPQNVPWWSEAAWYQRQAVGGKWIDGRIPPPTSIRAISLGAVAGATMGALREAQMRLRESKLYDHAT
ncbi:hypothetical protein K437DRAFT_263085 [Tilletiaria anomala UBC 951]|uniref:Uncharacterized protein n=1 Tax=Tilletiaria anomala (strain ATCC 24038 / CBS 436.72 / UBC 951) TaxID=1037660 RepID=A0A066VTB6_TILAU|nr:uncharacterized protein K437DRAFT_263085 [Tilletiaria anomala UBC 951]KDN44952.1 hypothetical protein K437DRAFT_263085 [Tilletiaria anomala UBC 951]